MIDRSEVLPATESRYVCSSPSETGSSLRAARSGARQASTGRRSDHQSRVGVPAGFSISPKGRQHVLRSAGSEKSSGEFD